MNKKQKKEWEKLGQIIKNPEVLEFENSEEELEYWSELSEMITLAYSCNEKEG